LNESDNDNVRTMPGVKRITDPEVIDAKVGASISVDEVLVDAAHANLEEIVIIGRRADGNTFLSFSWSYVPDVLWALERAKYGLMSFE
jgi:hypothetical protein